MAAPSAASIKATAYAAKAYCLEGRNQVGYGSKRSNRLPANWHPAYWTGETGGFWTGRYLHFFRLDRDRLGQSRQSHKMRLLRPVKPRATGTAPTVFSLLAGAVLHRQQVFHPGPAQWGLDAHCPNRCRDLAAISWGLDLGRGRAKRPPHDCPDGDGGPMASSWPLAIHCGRQPGHGIGQLLPLGLEFLKRGGCRPVCFDAAALEISEPRGKCGAR